jgi:hypothetical protein
MHGLGDAGRNAALVDTRKLVDAALTIRDMILALSCVEE